MKYIDFLELEREQLVSGGKKPIKKPTKKPIKKLRKKL